MSVSDKNEFGIAPVGRKNDTLESRIKIIIIKKDMWFNHNVSK
jgi:hypothetical protein